MRSLTRPPCPKAKKVLVGFICDKELGQAEEEFPGIRALYQDCDNKPKTFLELLARYLHIGGESPERSACASLPRARTDDPESSRGSLRGRRSTRRH